MTVHGGASVWSVLPRVCELPRHHPAELDVLTAAAPLPALTGRTLVAAAAAADGSGALGARACHSEGYAGGGDGVHKGGLPGGCGKRRRGWQDPAGLRWWDWRGGVAASSRAGSWAPTVG